MDLAHLWELAAHLENHLLELAGAWGVWSYVALFAVVFAETGLVVATALPSDTVLFAVGALAARGAVFDLWTTLFLMMAAAFLGDTANFSWGRLLGTHLLAGRTIPFLSPQALGKVREYYARHGGVTVVAARFVPVLRGLAPLVGGAVGMRWGEFLTYNALGKLLWTPLYLFGGYFFGRIPWVERNFSLAIFLALGAPLLGVLVRALYTSVFRGR